MAAGQETRNDPNDPDSKTDDGFVHEFDFGTLYLNTAKIGPDTQLLSAEIVSDAVAGPHGTTVYMFAQEVMNCYAQTNAELLGSRQSAAIYAEGSLPGRVRWGCVYRDGQRLQALEYASVEPAENGYHFAGVSYTMYENMVLAIHVYGLDHVIDEDEAINLASMVEGIRGETSYRQVPSSYTGSELAMFDEADLSFNGMDLHDVKPEQLAMLLGNVVSDNWVDDVEGGFIRVLTYRDCELFLSYDANKQHPVVDTLSVSGDGMEGPRCLRIGDSLTSVRNRFRYGEGGFDEETMVETLYAVSEDENASSGQSDYSMPGVVVVRYQAPMEDGRLAILMLTFEQMYLTDMMLVLQ